MRMKICNICGKSYNGDQYDSCPHCQGITGQRNKTGLATDDLIDVYEDKKTVFYQDTNEDQTDTGNEMVSGYSSDDGEVGSFICGNGHRIEGRGVTYCPFCGDRNIRIIGNDNDESTYVLSQKSENTDALFSDATSGVRSKKRNKLRTTLLIVGICLAALGIILCIVGVVKLRNAKKILEKAEKTDTTASAPAVSIEDTTEHQEEKPELTGIRVLMLLDKPYRISNATMMYYFEENGGTLNTRTTAKFRLEVQPIPAEAEIPEVEWIISDTQYMELNGSTVKMLAETAGLDALPSITAKTKDGKYSVSVGVDIEHAGWVWIGEHKYFITGSEKRLQNEWWEDSEKKLYVGEEGFAVTGWQIITDEEGRSAIYHFDEKTAYLDRTTKFTLKDGDNNEYIVNINDKGEVFDSWIILRGKWHFCNVEGTMLKNTTWKKYSFDENGALIEN